MGVGCIGLFGSDASLRARGARDLHDPPPPPTTRELNDAPLATRNCSLS
jgi:hypothetical protein